MHRQRRGSTAIEFALLFPMLCTLALGAIEYGAALKARAEMVNAVRESAWAISGEEVALADAKDHVELLLELHGFACSAQAADCQVDVRVEGDPSLLTVSVQATYVPVQTLVPSPERLGYAFTMAMAP